MVSTCSVDELHHVVGDGHDFKVFEEHFAVGAAVHLQAELSRFLARFVDDIRRAESVERLDQAIAVGGGAGRVPLVVLVADLFDELVVRDDPAATRNRLAVNNAGGVPEGGVFAVVGDFILESAQYPRGARFLGAEIQGAVAAVHPIRNASDEVVVILVGNDQPVFALALGVDAMQNAVFGEGPFFRENKLGIGELVVCRRRL